MLSQKYDCSVPVLRTSHVAQWNEPPNGRKCLNGTGIGVKPHRLNASIVGVSLACAQRMERLLQKGKQCRVMS
jgi:hypothetical protein